MSEKCSPFQGKFLAVQDFPDDPQARVSTQALIGFSIPVTRATTGLSIFRLHNAETNPTPSALSGLSPSRNSAPHLLLHPDTEALFTPDMHRLLRAWSSPVANFLQTLGKIASDACFPFPAKASSAPRRAVCKDDAEKGPERAWYSIYDAPSLLGRKEITQGSSDDLNNGQPGTAIMCSATRTSLHISLGYQRRLTMAYGGLACIVDDSQ